jgi:WD40 repeat protein
MSEINCPTCSRRLRVPEDMAGTPIRCPMCQSVFETAPTDGPLLVTPTTPADALQAPPRAPKPAPSATERGGADARRDWGQDRDEAPTRQESFPWLLLVLAVGLPLLIGGGLVVAGAGLLFFYWAREVPAVAGPPAPPIAEADGPPEVKLGVEREALEMRRRGLDNVDVGIDPAAPLPPEMLKRLGDLPPDVLKRLDDLHPEFRDLLQPNRPLPAHPQVPLLRSIAACRTCVWSVAFSADGATLLTADGYFGSPGHVKLWKTATGEELETLQRVDSDVLAAAFSRDNQLVAVAGGDRGLSLVERQTGRVRFNARHPSYVRSAALAPDGKRLASNCERCVRVWDAGSGQELWSADLHDELRAWRIATPLAFSPDGNRLAAGSGGNNLHVYEAATGRLLATCPGHEGIVICTAYSPDGKLLASGSFDQTVRLWDAATGRPLRTLSGHRDWVFSVAFTPDGKMLASAGREGRVSLWDAATGKELASFRAHASEAVCVAFAPDGKTLASSGVDGTVKLWDVSKLPKP